MAAMIAPRRKPEQARRAVLRAETIGILIVVLVGFVIVLLRYGRFIDWHAR
jgi:preprotein translocase subunit Sss1